MEFLGNISYGLIFWERLALGIILALPNAILLRIFIQNSLIRTILFVYICLFFLPFFVISLWVKNFYSIEVLFYVELFFISSIIFYLTFNYIISITPIKTIAYKYKYSYSYSNRQERLRRSILYFFILTSIYFLAYFFIFNPDHSGLITYFSEENTEKIPRFSIYESSNLFQFIYALFGRVLVPISVIVSKSKKTVFFVSLLSLTVLLHSVERQTIFILLFSFLAWIILNKRRVGLAEIILFLTLSSALFFVFIMQGNIDYEGVLNLILFGSQVVFQRVVVDPLYMVHHILYFYNDLPYTFGATSPLIGLIFGGYIAGYSAVGIIADGILAFGTFGVFLSAIWYGFLLSIISLFSNTKSSSLTGKFNTVLLFIAGVSFFYSNLFSLIPLALLAFVAIFYNLSRKERAFK